MNREQRQQSRELMHKYIYRKVDDIQVGVCASGLREGAELYRSLEAKHALRQSTPQTGEISDSAILRAIRVVRANRNI